MGRMYVELETNFSPKPSRGMRSIFDEDYKSYIMNSDFSDLIEMMSGESKDEKWRPPGKMPPPTPPRTCPTDPVMTPEDIARLYRKKPKGYI